MNITKDTKKAWCIEFDGLAEMVEFIRDTPRNKAASNSADREGCSMEWDLKTDMPAALDMAARGGLWAEGIDKMAEGIAAAAEQRQGLGYELQHDVAGFAVDVPAYLAGAPDCMMVMDGQAESSSAPIITIGIASLSASTDAYAAANRGIAAMSLVDVLEEAGYRCEVKVIWDNKSSYGDERSCTTVLIKRAGESWQPGPCSFMMAHPAARRRLGFAVFERGNDASAKVTNAGYGSGVETQWEQHGCDIIFEYMQGNSGYATLSQALATAEGKANKAGYEVKLTATD